MQSTNRQVSVPQMIVTPEEAQVYNMLGGGEARLLVTGEKSNGAWWIGRFSEYPSFMTKMQYHSHNHEQLYDND